MRLFFRHLILALLLTSLLCACGGARKKNAPALFAPELSTPPPVPPAGGHLEWIQQQIRKTLAAAPHPELLSVCVREVNSPLIVFEHNSEAGFTPAASVKILTCAAALDTLGATYRYKTDLIANGPIKGKALWGDLIVRGSGDPAIGGRFANPKDPAAIFRVWAGKLRSAGVERIDGSILADTRLFDQELTHPDWPLKQRGEAWCAPIAPLSFNENCVQLKFTGSWFHNRIADVESRPASKFYKVRCEVRTRKNDNLTSISLQRQPETDFLQAYGTLPCSGEYETRGTIGRPGEFFTAILRDTLTASGIPVSNPVTKDLRNVPDRAELTTTSKVVYTHQSPPLVEIAGACLKYNDNFIAEMLAKNIGLKTQGAATFETGTRALSDFIFRAQLNDWSPVLRDASGFSRRNTLSAGLTAAALRFIARQPAGPLLEKEMAQPGAPGILKDWFAELRKKEGDSARRIHAIRGEAPGTQDFAGFATSASGNQFTFAFMANDPKLSATHARQLFERLTEILVRSQTGAPPAPPRK